MVEHRWIVNDAYFGKVKDIWITYDNSLKQFVNNDIYNHPNSFQLLTNLSDLYILVASIGSQNYLKDGEDSWKDIMDKENYELLEKNKYSVIGYMMVTEGEKDIDYIEFIDTIIRKNNFAKYMIRKYEKNTEYKKVLIPKEIIESSANYWVKTLPIPTDEEDNIYRDYIDDFILENGINREDISWNNLYALCKDQTCD